ncbi:TPA: DmsC/YnfH family molybdoenzyme membrane anchor subunit, partial [Klebsiella pneumoniae]
LFTVLGQCVVGATIVSGLGWLALGDQREARRRLVRNMFFIWLLMGIGFLASVMHLGSPLRAFNSLNRIGASALSNEIASGALFFAVGGFWWLLAVLASSGSGAPGGVFTPTLFVGLAMGMLFACFSRLWLPGSEEMAIMMGLTGMAAFLAATTHAPIMSTLMICEMTGQYTLLPGLLITCVVSSVLSRTLRRDSIYRHHVAEHV